MKYNDKGSEVKAVQQELIKKGYKLEQHGADSHLGDETWDALQAFAKDNKLPWEPEVADLIISKLRAPATPPLVSINTNIVTPEKYVPIYDLRHEQPNPPNVMPGGHPKCKIGRNGKVVLRAVHTVDSITVHQTAIKFSVTDAQIKDAGGNRTLALARRSKNVACHVMAFSDGFIAWPNPLDWYIYHGNGFNRTDLGIEIDGRFPGLKDNPNTQVREDWKTTWNGTPDKVTDELVAASRAGINLLVTEGRKMGMPIRYIKAHRQSSDTRRNDPGQELWERVVLQYAVPVLKLETQPNLVIDGGMPIPLEWDPDGSGHY
jgi:peptidoglycan hydrolase-like protein with peptidoglycan-binding domain